jgi:hypothetical protein
VINHFRTHLLNVARNGNSLLTAGEEYISPDYQPRKANELIQYMHAVLFGNNPDREYLNLRGRQLIELVHASELADLILIYDTRLTYLPWKPVFDTAVAQKTTITKITNAAGVQLITTGTTALNSNTNKSRHKWQMRYEYAGSNELLVTVSKQTAPAITYPVSTHAFLSNSDYSELIKLPNTPIKLTIVDTVKTIGVEVVWNIEILELPRVDIAATMYQLYTNSEEYLSLLFPAGGTQLQQTLLNVMLSDRSIVNKYAAILLGLSEYISLQPQAN